MKSKLTWVPNALSLGNLTFGFISILVASSITLNALENSKLFLISGVLICFAAIFDGFDGMAARALNATSDLGAELDTLADLTTFGIAPGFLMYKMILEKYKIELLDTGNLFPMGMLIAALFPICAAYRLARFTVQHDPNSFTGLPSPIAGVLIALFPISFPNNEFADVITITGFVLIALLMVSTIKYSKPQVAMRGRYTKGKLMIATFSFLITILATILIIPGLVPYLIYGLFIMYVFSGIISLVIHVIQQF
jgi:CDP-diacylglycerol---serine O-phosphatidyltransferase